MSQKFRMKDFEIRDIRVGSRLQGGPEWGYEIIFHAPNGKSVRLNQICYTKESARNYIRQTIKIAEKIRKNGGKAK